MQVSTPSVHVSTIPKDLESHFQKQQSVVAASAADRYSTQFSVRARSWWRVRNLLCRIHPSHREHPSPAQKIVPCTYIPRLRTCEESGTMATIILLGARCRCLLACGSASAPTEKPVNPPSFESQVHKSLKLLEYCRNDGLITPEALWDPVLYTVLEYMLSRYEVRGMTPG